MGTRYSIEGDYPKGQIVKGNPVQGRYTKGSAAYQTSSRLKEFQGCIRSKMAGESYDSIADVNDALKKAAEECEES